MVVDSCLKEPRGRPIALEYLESVNVDVSRQVKLVVVTHWHDDHIQGVAEVVRASSSARFACSAALQSREFFEVVAASENVKLVENTSGVSEFADLLTILENRSPSKYKKGPVWAIEGRILYSETAPVAIEVHALSPSDQTMLDAMGRFAMLFPPAEKPIGRFPSIGPNDLSVALLIRTTGLHLLLGADLEQGRDISRGWQAVVGSPTRPRVKSCGFKVAHHGSEGADLPGIWTDLIVENAHVLLTPYANSGLPKESDIRRIKGMTEHVYCTVYPPTIPPPRRIVDRTMNEVARSRRAVSRRPGHIRLRTPFNGDQRNIRVDLFDGSKQL